MEAHCGALYAHPQLYFAINITASSCHSSCDATPLKKPNLVKNYSKFREIKAIFRIKFRLSRNPKSHFRKHPSPNLSQLNPFCYRIKCDQFEKKVCVPISELRDVPLQDLEDVPLPDPEDVPLQDSEDVPIQDHEDVPLQDPEDVLLPELVDLPIPEYRGVQLPHLL